METEVYIAIGSNLGDRELNLLLAIAELGKLNSCRITALSSFYETTPVGMPEGTPAFYNAVARISTTISPQDLLHELQRIERERFRRSPSTGVQSRSMDLDLLLYGDQLLATPELTVPHPRMGDRRFVLVPLTEIAPFLREPNSGELYTDLLRRLASTEQIRKVE